MHAKDQQGIRLKHINERYQGSRKMYAREVARNQEKKARNVKRTKLVNAQKKC